MCSTNVGLYLHLLPSHKLLLLQFLLRNLQRENKLVNVHSTRNSTTPFNAQWLLRKVHFISSLIQRCPKWSSLQPSEKLYFRRTLTIIPFSSETPPPLAWERSAPSQWGSFRCGMGSSCRGWCVHGHGKYAYASLGPCSPGCARSPESPHPNPTRSQCGMK